jgi:hypothetical protein
MASTTGESPVIRERAPQKMHLERFSPQCLAASDSQVLSRPLPGPHPALSQRERGNSCKQDTNFFSYRETISDILSNDMDIRGPDHL